MIPASFPDGTYTVSQLTAEVRDFLSEAFPPLWVVGEVQRRHASRNGHLYFELVEKGPGDRIVGKLDTVLWRTTHQRVARRLRQSDGQMIVDGQEIRCRGRLDFYGPAGRLQLVVDEVDPLFTLGLLERRRRETLAALTAAGLVERNRQLTLSPLPLAVGLVTSEGSAAYHDFLAGLAESGFGFRVLFAHAAVQGREAEAEVAAALRRLAAAGGLDCAAVIRGGGSRSDLAAFDSRRIAETIARSPLPVLTGLGHEIDRSLADVVSHRAFKTPTKVAEFLVARIDAAERRLDSHRTALARRGEEAVRRARRELRPFERLPRLADLRLRAARLAVADSVRALELLSRRRLREARGGLEQRAARLTAAAPRLVDRRRPTPELLVRRLADAARRRLRQARTLVDGHRRLCAELAPERLLERGFSITRDAAGKILQQPAEVRPGETIATQLAGGFLRSRVEDEP